jgi:hypothetical protein
MPNLMPRHATPAVSQNLRSSSKRAVSSRRVRFSLDGFERRWLLSDASPSPTTCPTCGGSHTFCVSGDPAWQQQVAEQLGLASPDGPEYQVGGRWTSTAAGSTGSAGNPVTLSWGFVADGLSIPGFNGEPTAPSSLQARLNAIYGSSTTWVPIFQNVFNRWSTVSGLTYNYFGLSDDGAAFGSAAGVNGVRPDIRIGAHPIDGASNVLAYNFFPDTGDMVIDSNDLQGSGYMVNTTSSSLRLRNVVAHEHGHGMGLNHVMPVPGDAVSGGGTKLMEPFVSTAFDGPQFDDILAAQANYGDPFEKNGRNDTAPTASSLGTLGNQTNASVSAWVSANNPTTPRSIANTGDLDFLSFAITGTKNVTFTVAPFGPTYNSGIQPTQQNPNPPAPSAFNASAQGNLSIAIISSNGSTVLSSANVNGLGGSETVTVNNLAAGTYYLRVGLGAGNTVTPTQAYNVNATVVDSVAVPPPAPSTPDLTNASDSGTFNNDNVTFDNTPTFTGTAEVGSTVNLLFNGVAVGSFVATSGSYSITASARPDGVYTVTTTATNSAGTGPASGSLTVTIDTTAPLAPQNLRVLAADDSGVSSSDNITNDTTPRLIGTAEANSLVDIAGPGGFAGNFAGGTDFIASFGAATLPEGVSNIIATTTDLAGNSSSGIASFNVTIDTIAPAAPTAGAVLASDDSGVSALDGVTNIATPRITGNAENNARIEILSGLTVLATATSTGTYISSALPPRPEGSQSYAVRATDVAGNASASTGLVTFVVDTIAPTITGRTFVRSDRQALVVDFAEEVFATGTLQFNNTTTSSVFSTAQVGVDSDTREYRVAGNVLTDGVYNASFSAGTMTDLAGNAVSATNPLATLNYLRADFNNDSAVNFDDLLLLAANYNAANTNAGGDANYDGQVNFDDLLILAASYNTSLPGVVAVSAPPAAPEPEDEPAPGIAGDIL